MRSSSGGSRVAGRWDRRCRRCGSAIGVACLQPQPLVVLHCGSDPTSSFAYGSAPGSGAGRALRTRSAIHELAKPSLKMPPGWAMSYMLPRNDIGAIAARCAGGSPRRRSGCSPRTRCRPLPTRPPLTHGWLPTVLDDVVAVVGGRQVEQVALTTRATGATQLHRHHREARQSHEHAADGGLTTGRGRVGRQTEQLGDLVHEGLSRRGDLVAGVLDQGGERSVGQAEPDRRAHRRRKGDAVAHRDVVEPLTQAGVRVERLRRMVLVRRIVTSRRSPLVSLVTV